MNKRLLVVEDDPHYLGLLALRLEKAGFPVEAAPGGEAAKRRFAQSPAPIVITDLVMPKVDGIDLLRFVKARRPETEVVLLSGRGTIEQAVEAMRMGAFDFLVKPAAKGRMERLVRQCFETIRRRRESGGTAKAIPALELDASRIQQPLTKTEARIVRLILKGMSDQKIAEELFVSFHTVRTHLQNIFRKTAVRNRVELIVLLK